MSVNSEMTKLANAIRAKTGRTGKMSIDTMVAEIAAIDTGDTDVSYIGVIPYECYASTYTLICGEVYSYDMESGEVGTLATVSMTDCAVPANSIFTVVLSGMVSSGYSYNVQNGAVLQERQYGDTVILVVKAGTENIQVSTYPS